MAAGPVRVAHVKDAGLLKGPALVLNEAVKAAVAVRAPAQGPEPPVLRNLSAGVNLQLARVQLGTLPLAIGIIRTVGRVVLQPVGPQLPAGGGYLVAAGEYPPCR